MAASSRQSSNSSSSSSSNASFFRRPSPDHQTHFVPDFEFDDSDLYDSSTSSNKIRKASKLGTMRRMKPGSAKVADESRSVPVSIPAWPTRAVQEDSECSDDDEGEDRVPPHEYLARKRGASLSVHEGAGRTLKGRDMSGVRDAVWKRTGYED